jgi:hypothetical protein
LSRSTGDDCAASIDCAAATPQIGHASIATAIEIHAQRRQSRAQQLRFVVSMHTIAVARQEMTTPFADAASLSLDCGAASQASDSMLRQGNITPATRGST